MKHRFVVAFTLMNKRKRRILTGRIIVRSTDGKRAERNASHRIKQLTKQWVYFSIDGIGDIDFTE